MFKAVGKFVIAIAVLGASVYEAASALTDAKRAADEIDRKLEEKKEKLMAKKAALEVDAEETVDIPEATEE